MIKILLSGFFLIFTAISFSSAAKSTPARDEEHMKVFNIQAYEELKAQNGGSKDIQFYRPDGVLVRYLENDTDYSKYLIERGVYWQSRFYYKPSGILKSESGCFQGNEIGTSRLYNADGSLHREFVHTPDGWLERLTRLARERFNVDVWNRESAQIFQKFYQGKPVIELLHLDGKEIEPMGLDTDLKFAFLDYKTLDIIVEGERHLIRSPNMTRDPRIGVRQYIVDGQEIFIDK